MCMEKTDWEKCIDFHGHSCPGLAIGYRVAKTALEKLAEDRDQDEELVAIVENDACGVDAIMFLTGCTLGKGNLIYRDYGKQVYTFGSRDSKTALRLVIKDQAWRGQENLSREERMEKILTMPEEELIQVETVDMDLPPKARIFATVQCAHCGENVMEARARVKDGKFACIPCAGEYTRGW